MTATGKPISPEKERFLRALFRRCGVTEDGHTYLPEKLDANQVMLAIFENEPASAPEKQMELGL